MNIEIIDDENYLTPDQSDLLKGLINLASKKLEVNPHSEVDISIVDNERIQQLNRDFRNKDQATDVLSFALNEGEEWLELDSFIELEECPQIAPHLGDIIISIERAKEQAIEYGHSIDRELGFLAVHGFLHLNGFDHQTAEEEKEMFALQDEVLKEYGLCR
ncbi:rRNA maturation RNase YbeY [Facklamia hominis]|uniref:Endoribonuclease YbeY n=1 Tax=Facklamia hominis TaxID=178214 RepID=A0AAJ1Q7I8_9LACT|nr:rRNA maturation RNase YbeY [Facklamia hominis]MDK7187980.1 rRNA maturation RNase YbeY [Facklamia hominis]